MVVEVTFFRLLGLVIFRNWIVIVATMFLDIYKHSYSAAEMDVCNLFVA